MSHSDDGATQFLAGQIAAFEKAREIARTATSDDGDDEWWSGYADARGDIADSILAEITALRPETPAALPATEPGREWAGDYDGTDCPNCGRERMLLCANGKRRCEKCNWDPDASDYSEAPAC